MISDHAAFKQNGWVLCREVADANLLSDSRQALTQQTLARCKSGTKSAFMPVSNLWVHDPICSAFVHQSQFATKAAHLLGVEHVRLYHDQAMFSEPGAVATPWHQDAQHWAVPGNRCLTMWLALENIDTNMGTLTYASGSHRAGLLGDWPINEKSQQYFSTYLSQENFPIVNAGAMAAGDALFHDGWVIHGAPPNVTTRMRAVMTILFVAAETKLLTPLYPDQLQALNDWTPGQVPGDVVGSSLNPLLK